MYENYFGLHERPFSILPDPSFIYWTKAHTRAYAMLEYSILHNAGITVICGEIGCGKTTLIQHLLSQIMDQVVVGQLADTQVSPDDLIRWVLLAFELECEQKTEPGAYREFRNFLVEQKANHNRVILIVDEAQNLSIAALEKLRMLSNITMANESCLQIILAGQPQLRRMLQRPDMKQFTQRVTSEFNIEPLSLSEVKHYISHRLSRAGSPWLLFSDRAIHRIAEESSGVPRVINVLCDTALVYAYARSATSVDSRIVELVISDRKSNGLFTPATANVVEIEQARARTAPAPPPKIS